MHEEVRRRRQIGQLLGLFGQIELACEDRQDHSKRRQSNDEEPAISVVYSPFVLNQWEPPGWSSIEVSGAGARLGPIRTTPSSFVGRKIPLRRGRRDGIPLDTDGLRPGFPRPHLLAFSIRAGGGARTSPCWVSRLEPDSAGRSAVGGIVGGQQGARATGASSLQSLR